MEILIFKDERGYKRKMTKENYERLPASYQAKLSIWEDPIEPVFLKALKEENGTSEGNESENSKGVDNGNGSGKRSGKGRVS